MNSLISAKLILGLLGVTTIVGIVNTAVKDQSFQSTAFMSDSEIKSVKSFSDYDSDRDVASINSGDELDLPRVPLNLKNIMIVDGVWEITRILTPKSNKEDEVVYDSTRPLDREAIITLPVKLIATSQVRFDKDSSMDFYILSLNESISKTTITASFIRPLQFGYEIIEAKKVVTYTKLIEATTSKINDKITSVNSGVQLKEDQQVSMRLHKVLFPKFSTKVLDSTSRESIIDGLLVVRNESIEHLSFTLRLSDLRPISKNEENLDIDIDLNYLNLENGTFTFRYDNRVTSGLITKNGKSGYKVRFITGSLQGASLSFIVEDEYSQLSEDELSIEEENNIEEQGLASSNRKDSQVEEDEEVNYQRDNTYGSYDEDNMDSNVEEINSQSVKAVIQESGFNFNS